MSNRRTTALLFALLLSGCPTPGSYPLQICTEYEEPCTAGFECVGYRCIQQCSFEGDCDPGFRCVGGSCLQACEQGDDCTIGECDAIGDGRPGSACALRNLPACATDEHCGWGVCAEDACLSRCDWEGACGQGSICDFRRGDYGACVEDPDYEPPPPASVCGDSQFPDLWCEEMSGWANAYCDGRTCRPIYVAALILDETQTAFCTDDDPSPGTDLAGVRLSDDSGTYVTVHGFGAGAGNTHTDPSLLETANQPACEEGEERWLSLGCGGGIVVIPGDGRLDAGSEIEVYTTRDWCGVADSAVASVYVCGQYPADLDTAATVCDRYVGAASDLVLQVPSD